ncbi:hypothetical protein OH491_18030 [Termitidicoccus mucosus]|uniref:Glycoside hydrolase family 2 immunoglobulin-like beta-sandwich domain-containing protein n=1 Tax=Termitidicoccus mucosus TaxID=1184151 RepID=A0A178IIQ5_9BACT|nr:hypothetical protein AW736_10580 [Opitutaceae bacterium TSB47]
MKTKLLPKLLLPLLALACGVAPASLAASDGDTPLRHVVSLDGAWQIAEGGMEQPPAAAFSRTVPVPGLVDMARPAFDNPGPPVADRRQFPQKDPKRDAFWYRRAFTLDGPVPPAATLKIGKAMFGARVFLNGRQLGDHAPSFTPALLDARAALKPGENEIVVRVGADRDAVRPAVPDGFDFEKSRYIPGIFDSVQLILSGAPRIANVQVAPDIAGGRAKIRVYASAPGAPVSLEIREWKSRRVVATAAGQLDASGESDFVLPIENTRLWSPADPFLYEATVRTAGDEFTARFGMREFYFDKKTGRPFLNGKPHYLRGSNITLYRFFEDPARGDLPWDKDWVRALHRRARDMHWEALRYCIGFPPEFWYDIADEEGILIQDEFPIWYLRKDWPAALQTPQLVREYSEWMRERWNHPCVVIWDASNETASSQTGPAIEQVRSLDLSDRPWDNSWSPTFRPGDVFESHPYHFGNRPPRVNFRLAGLANADSAPWKKDWDKSVCGQGVIINEYAWLWLNRDGAPTTLTEKLYQNLLGPGSTTAQRFRLYARWLAADTEFWRSRRTAAGVLHFTMLGYDRPDGQTSDHWLDIASLKWEPEFYKHVRDAFAPIGVALDAWEETYPPGLTRDFPCVIINDTDAPHSGTLAIRLRRDGKVLAEETRAVVVKSFETGRETFELTLPKTNGPCEVEAVLLGTPSGDIRSVRDFIVHPLIPAAVPPLK